MKIIPKISPSQQLKGILPEEIRDSSFAILDPKNNFHNTEEMAELYSAINGNDDSKSVIDLVAFKPDRLLAHHIITELVTSVQMINLEEDFKAKFEAVKESINVDNFVREGVNLREENIRKMREISNNPNPSLIEESEAKNIFLTTQIHPDYAPGKFVEGATTEEMRIIAAADKLTNKQLNERAQTLVVNAIDSKIHSAELLPLTNHPADDRITLSVNGAIASGKGTSEVILRHYAEETLGHPWQDFMKINGDSLKLILNSQDGMSEAGKEVFSQLVQDEVNYLGVKINDRLREKLHENGRAPNVFLDKSMMTPEHVEMATYGTGKVQGIVVSLDAETAYTRSMERGKKTGRYEDSKGILDAHATIANKFTDFIVKNKGKNITYSVYDNNVNIGEQPQAIARFDLKEGTFVIKDQEKFIAFLSKSALDVTASISNQTVMYKNVDPEIQKISFLATISKAGFSQETRSGSSIVVSPNPMLGYNRLQTVNVRT